MKIKALIAAACLALAGAAQAGTVGLLARRLRAA